MAERQFQIGKVKIVLTHSTAVLKALVVILVVLSITALVALNWVGDTIRDQTEKVRQEALALEYQNEVLEGKIQQLGTPKGDKQVAQDELGMVPENSIVIKTH